MDVARREGRAPWWAVVAALAWTACADAPAPVMLPVRADAAIAPRPSLPSARLDPTLRFGAPVGRRDADPLQRPQPWIPDAPALEALLPTAPARSLEEEWATWESCSTADCEHLILHRVQGLFTVPDAAAALERVRAAVWDWSLSPRSSPPPVLTLRRATGPHPPAVRVWATDRARAAPVLVFVEALDASTLQLALVAFHPASQRAETLDAFAAALPDSDGVRDLARLGALTRARYTRDEGRPPSLEVEVARPPDRDVEAALARLDGPLERQFARMRPLQDRADRRWQAQLARWATAHGFHRARDPRATVWLHPRPAFLLATTGCTLQVGRPWDE